MPQLDISTFPTQIFWLAIMFAILWVLMSVFAMPRIGALLDERQRRIDDNLERAAKLKAEAESAVAAYEKILTEARAEAQRMVRAVTEEAAKRSEAQQRELGDKLSTQIKAADERIAAAKNQALADIRTIAADLAHDATIRLTGIDIDRQVALAAVGSVVGEEH